MYVQMIRKAFMGQIPVFFQHYTRMEMSQLCHGDPPKKSRRDGVEDKEPMDRWLVQIGNDCAITLPVLLVECGDLEMLTVLMREIFAHGFTHLDPRRDLWCRELKIMCIWEFLATLEAVRFFVPDEKDELRRSVELWLLRAYFQDEYGHLIKSSDQRAKEWTGRVMPFCEVRLSSQAWMEMAFICFLERAEELGLGYEDLEEDVLCAIERNYLRIDTHLSTPILRSRYVENHFMKRGGMFFNEITWHPRLQAAFDERKRRDAR